jgi:hypothetical protein
MFVAACSLFTSWSDVMMGWVGHPVEEITELWGPPEKLWVREDGKSIYKYHAKDIDPSCFHYWIVNDQKVIVDFYYEGYCRPVG